MACDQEIFGCRPPHNRGYTSIAVGTNLSSTPVFPPKFIDCRDRCTYAYATAAIFQKRAAKYKKCLQWLTFLGLALPLAIGGVVAADLFGAGALKQLIWVAGAIGVVQLIISLWSVVADWPGELESAILAGGENSRLANEFDALAKQFATPPGNFNSLYDILTAQDNAQQIADERQFITKDEKRYGHRAALYQYGIKCAKCQTSPTFRDIPSAAKTPCDTCGGN
jgi:mobilome CxxCx(11)CxxC protein